MAGQVQYDQTALVNGRQMEFPNKTSNLSLAKIRAALNTVRNQPIFATYSNSLAVSQPRRYFETKAINLVASIREHGILQPLLVRLWKMVIMNLSPENVATKQPKLLD